MNFVKGAHPLPGRVERFLCLLDQATLSLGLHVPAIVTMEQLRSLPPDTFGRAWMEHLEQSGLQPFTQGPRRKQLHDGVHVLTGYGIDPLGEAEVQAFLVGAKLRLANLLLLAGLVLSLNRQGPCKAVGVSRAEVRSRLQAAYLRGQHGSFDPDTWQPERLWNQPLAEVKARFGI